MLTFWSLAVLLVAATLALLLLPLLRARRARAAPDADAAAFAVYRDQKYALDAELADGAIGAEEHEAAIAELSRRLAEDVGPAREPAPPTPPLRRAWLIGVALLVLIPAAAAVLYARLGNPEAISGASSAGEPNAHEMSDPQILAMVDSLAQRLKTRPDDAEGWVLLARSYQTLGRFSEAADAYAHADTLIPNNPALLADYADALAMAQGRKLAGQPAALAARALSVDPNHKKALALAATAALEARDVDAALAYWRRLLAQFPEGSDDAKQIMAIVAEVESAKNGLKAPPPAAQERPRSPAATVPAAGATIAGRVDISPALASKVALTDTVFIFARAVEGSRMPLAVLRIPARELPKDFRLDDSMGMAPGVKLSAAPAVIVEARISKSGNALPQAGDLSGKSAPVKPGASGIKITIDQVVP